MARITYYTNSFLANVVQIFAYLLLFGGIAMLMEGEIAGGVICILAALALMVLASWISERKAFKKWWKQVENANLVPEIAKSLDVAVQIYNKNPRKMTLEKIRSINPNFAAEIERLIELNKQKKGK